MVSGTETAGSLWTVLYKTAGVAALMTVFIIPVQVIIFILFPFPANVAGWFALFQNNWLAGLIDLDLLLVVDNVLFVPVFLALYIALKRASESIMTIATALGFLGLVLFITFNPSFQMLSLSSQFAAATTDAEKSVLLAAGQVMLANWQGTAFQVAYFVGSISGILMSAVMLRSPIFSKLTAYVGMLGNIVSLGLYVPVIGIYISVFSVLFLWIWYILIGIRLLRLGSR